MHTVPQKKDKFTMNNLFYCCEALIFTHPLVYKFLCGLIFMGHPVFSNRLYSKVHGCINHIIFQKKMTPLKSEKNLSIACLKRSKRE